MKRVSLYLCDSPSGQGYSFWCPGCQEAHSVSVTGPGGWGFNGDLNRPTFHPSIKVTGKQTEKDEHGQWTGRWKVDADGKALDRVCHSFVKNGQIEYQSDCTHALAGKTVALPTFPDAGCDQAS